MADSHFEFELTVLSGILSDPLISAFAAYRTAPNTSAARVRFLHELFRCGAETDFAAYVADAVLKDENAFSRACAAGQNISPYLRRAYIADLETIGRALNFESPDFQMGKTGSIIRNWDEHAANLLYGYYQSYGYGKFISNGEFRYEKSGMLVPIRSAAVQLSDLKGYEREKAEIYDNLENFVKKLPYCDMLLYGDRGTGKSSTVHAMASAFFSQKLRLVELAKEDIARLYVLKAELSRIPLRFLIFIDDFSLREGDDRISTLKTALQGSSEESGDNVMIVATSNRRHLIDEQSAPHEHLHGRENEQELLSLSDRFGITVLFSATDKDEYLRIVKELAKDYKLRCSAAELEALAERWALLKGGRSPRRARQLVGYLSACQRKNKEVKL